MPPLTFLPQLRDLHLDSIAVGDDRITLMVSTVRRTARCPLCQCRSRRVHSRYTRTLVDLPWSGHGIMLQIRARRFWCCRARCRRRIFCERIPRLAPAHARRTIALRETLESLGFARGGRPGERLAPCLGVTASRMTLLRLIRAVPDADVPTPRVVGVDDWAQQKGHSYGTILVDLERHCPIDLLPDRSADMLIAWLERHPGIEIISRDRAGAYADGARRGAPNAIQIADRWHLLKNLGDALERFLVRHDRMVQEAARDAGSDESVAEPEIVEAAPHSQAQRDSEERRARRLRRFDEVRSLHQEGESLREVARITGLSRQTVRRYVQAVTFPEMKRCAGRRTLLDPYKDQLLRRWNEGCRNGHQLYRELKAAGYPGGRTGVTRYVTELRRCCGLAPRSHASGGTVASRGAPHRISARWVVWHVLRRSEECTAEDQTYIDRLCQMDDSIAVVVSICQQFGTLLCERRGRELDAWTQRAEASGSIELQAFVRSIRQDWAAVLGALSQEISNGQTEGQVNRLKTIKRQMYGRANFDLLRKRVLHVA